MKNSTLLLTVSFLFVSLAACEGGSGASSDSRLFHFMSASHDGHGGFGGGRHLRGPGGGFSDDDAFLADGRGRRHQRDGQGRGFHRQGMGPGMGMRMNHRDGQGEGRGMHDGQGRGRGMGNGEVRGMHDGQGRGMRNGEGRHMGPPAEALTACEGKAAGDACSFVIEGDTVASTCSARRSGEGPLACRAGMGTHSRHDTPAK